MKVGSLLIDMAADVARLRADMNTAQGVVSSAVNKMQSAVDGLKKGIAGLAAGLIVGAFSAAIKNQLDIADAMGKTAERTGLAVKDVAGLKLAFDMSGVSSDKLETSLGKMAKNMAEGSKAFGAMGVQIKNADGTLRSTRDVLGDVADKFAGYRDGAEKTALAQELFGKSGTEMISVLNAGRAGLDEMDAQAKRLGLTLDEEATAKATQFNDTLTLLQAGGEGFTRQIAGRLAPTLASLAGELLGNVNQSESLNTISNVLSATLKGLYSAGAIGAQIFANLGRAVGAGAAAIMAVLRGDFAGAKDIMNDVASVNAANWKSQLESLGRLWDDTGAKGVQTMAGVSAASRSAAPTVASVGAAAKQAKDEFADLLNKLNAKDSGVDADYFKNLNILFAGFQKGRIGLGEYRAAVEQLTQSQQFAKDIQKQLIEVAKEHTAGVDAAIKADEDALLKNEASIKTAREMLEQIQFETRALKMTNVERAKAIALRDLERQGIEAGTQAYEAYAEAILKALDEKAVTEASIEAQNQIREEWQKTTDQMGQSLADALMNGGKSVAEYLKGLFRNLVLRPIIQPVATAMAGGFMGLFGGPAAAAGQGGGGTNLLGGLGNLFGGSAAGAGGFGGFMGLGSFGSGFGAGLGALFGEAGLMGGLSAGATAIGAGNILGGLGTLAGVAAPILGPLALLGLSGAFSRKHEQHNLQGTFGGASGFEGNWHDYYKGGLFRSSKTVDTPLEADFLKGLQDAWNAQEAAVTSYAQALGLATDSIAGFTYDVNIKLKDLDPKAGDYQQQLMARVADAIKAGSNEMAQQLIGSWDTVQETVTRHVQQFGDDGFSTVEETITRQTYVASEFAREGESAIDTLTRLGSSLQAVNSVFDTLGYTLLSASLASGDLASSIIDAFGGQERFGAQTGSYFQNYYSAAERRATLQRQLTDEMDRLGFVLPATRDGFRRLVEAQRLTTTEGQQTYAALIGLSGAFAEITQSSEEAAQALSDATDRAFADLSRYIGQQRELWQTALQAAQTLVAEARDIRDTASGAARELWGQSDDTRAMLAVQGRATIDRMLSGLRATGALPDADELSRAIEDARGGLDMSQYATVAEYELAQALLAGQLSEIGDLAGEQMTVAEKQVAAAEAQIKQLDQTLDFWREQIDLMRDTFDVITNLDAGIAVLADAVRAEQAAKAEAEARAAATPTSPGGGGWGGWGGGGGGGPTYTATPTTIYASDEDEIADAVARYAAVGLRAYAYLNPSGTWSVSPGLAPYDETRLMDLRQYASGGLHSGGLRLVGERGPELEVTGPARYWSHEQTRSMFRGGGGDQTALLEELQALRAEIRELRAAAASGAKAAQDTHNLLDRVSAGGNALLVEAA